MSPRSVPVQRRVDAVPPGPRRRPQALSAPGRALALLLCAQPVFWTSNVALAQSLQPAGELGPSPASRPGGDPTAPSSGRLEGPFSPPPAGTRRVSFVQGDTVRTLLERLGGVGSLADLQGSYLLRAGASIPVDLYALLVLRDLAADRPVELGDSLVVPFKRRNVLVEGAVFRPGSYPFNPNYGIQQYLSLAGGPNRFALPIDDLRVVTPDGQMRPYAPDLKVEPGSSLVMPERNFSRAEVVQIILGAAGILLSGAALVVALQRP